MHDVSSGSKFNLKHSHIKAGFLVCSSEADFHCMSPIICAGEEQPVDCFLITFHFLEKANSCPRCGPPSCHPLSAICSLQSSPFPSIPHFLLTCDDLAHLHPLIVCFISLSSTSSIFFPTPHCCLFPPQLLSCSTPPGFLPGSPSFPSPMALFAKCCLPSPSSRRGRPLAEGSRRCQPR